MRNLLKLVVVSSALAAGAQTNTVPEVTVAPSSGLSADAGADIEELYDWAMAHRRSVLHWFCSTDLTYYVKGGRVSKVGGVLGGIFEICPLLNVSPAGKLVVISKVRTKKKVLTALVNPPFTVMHAAEVGDVSSYTARQIANTALTTAGL